MRIGGGGGWISLGPPNKDWGERGEGGGGGCIWGTPAFRLWAEDCDVLFLDCGVMLPYL